MSFSSPRGLFIIALAIAGACADDLSSVQVRRIPIEKRWDHPVPSEVPEVPVVLREGIFYGDSPNHPVMSAGEKPYTPLREGGFRMEDGPRYFNRPLFFKGNMIGTGDRPMFLITRGYGKQWASKLRFAFTSGVRTRWLDQFTSITTEFWPGHVQYTCSDPDLALTVKLTAASGTQGLTSLFELEVGGVGAAGASIQWVYGEIVNQVGDKSQMWWLPKAEFGQTPANRATKLSDIAGSLTIDATEEHWKRPLSTMLLSTMEFYAGAQWEGQRLMVTDAESVNGPAAAWKSNLNGALIAATAPIKPGWKGVLTVVWGGPPNQESLAKLERDMRELKLEWGMPLYQEWRANFVDRGAHPREVFEASLAAPTAAIQASRQFWSEISARVRFDLPDDELTAWANWLAATQEYLHWPVGQMASVDIWGQIYLHISNMYSGWDYLGAHDQQEQWLRLFGASVRNGWIGLYHGIAPWAGPRDMAHGGEEDQIAHYVNYVYTHWLWTADRQFLKDLWPFVKEVLDRELMQNDPDHNGLFASRYPYWGPEDDSWGPDTGLQTAQVLRALEGAAELAKVAGDTESQLRYAEYAAKGRHAFPKLWDAASGVLGWRDPLGVLHTQPGAQEIFLPILRGAVGPLESYQMLRYVRENLWSEVYPGTARIWLCGDYGGRHALGPLPDVAWSTVAAAGITGEIDHFYPVLKTYAHSYFFSSFPGGECSGVSAWGSGSAGMNDHNDGRMPALYLLGRGLFGLEPDLPHNRITVEPRFPSTWPTASIRTPDLSYSLRRSADEIAMTISTPRQVAKVLRIPVIRDVAAVMIDGRPAQFHVDTAVNHGLVVVECAAGTRNEILVRTTGPEMKVHYQSRAIVSKPFEATVEGTEKLELLDPQHFVGDTSAGANSVRGTPTRPGNRTAFVKATRGRVSFYLPLDFRVSETFEIANPKFHVQQRQISFDLLNPTGEKAIAIVHTGGRRSTINISAAASVPVSVAADALTPGSNPIELEIAGRTYRNPFIDWKPAGSDLFRRCVMLDLAWDYHEEANSLFNTKFYYDAWQMGIDYPVLPPATYEWAGHHIDNPKLTSDRFLSTQGVPFYLASERKLGGVYQGAQGGGPRNVLPVANWRPGLYPSNLIIPVTGQHLSKAYFLAYSWQRGHKTYHPNVELIANYADGTRTLRQLIPPYSFMPQRELTSANKNPYRAEVTSAGLVIDKEKEVEWYLSRREKVSEQADVYDLPIDPTRALKSIEVRSVATESIFAIFGITLVNPE